MGETAGLTPNTVRQYIATNPAEARALLELFGADARGQITGRFSTDAMDESQRRLLETYERALEAGYVPELEHAQNLARPNASQGLNVDRSTGELVTSDGYRFSFANNTVHIDWPGREGGNAETSIRGRDVLEGDGT